MGAQKGNLSLETLNEASTASYQDLSGEIAKICDSLEAPNGREGVNATRLSESLSDLHRAGLQAIGRGPEKRSDLIDLADLSFTQDMSIHDLFDTDQGIELTDALLRLSKSSKFEVNGSKDLALVNEAVNELYYGVSLSSTAHEQRRGAIESLTAAIGITEEQKHEILKDLVLSGFSREDHWGDSVHLDCIDRPTSEMLLGSDSATAWIPKEVRLAAAIEIFERDISRVTEHPTIHGVKPEIVADRDFLEAVGLDSDFIDNYINTMATVRP